MLKHIRRWIIWGKKNVNGPLYQTLVLLGLKKSPTMRLVELEEEIFDRNFVMEEK